MTFTTNDSAAAEVNTNDATETTTADVMAVDAEQAVPEKNAEVTNETSVEELADEMSDKSNDASTPNDCHVAVEPEETVDDSATEPIENSTADDDIPEDNDKPVPPEEASSDSIVIDGEKADTPTAEEVAAKPEEEHTLDPPATVSTESDPTENAEEDPVDGKVEENVGEKRPSPSANIEEEAPAKTQKVDASVESSSEQAVIAQQ